MTDPKDIESRAQEARGRVLDEHREACFNGGPDDVPFKPVTWSQSFPDPATHPEEAKAWFLRTINMVLQDSANRRALAHAIHADAITLTEALDARGR